MRWTPWRAVIVVVVAILPVTGWAANNSFLPVIAKAHLGLEPTEVGMLVSAFSVSSIVLSAPLGHLSDRFGRQRTIVVGLLAMALGAIGLGWADDFLSLFLAPILNALGFGLCSPAIVALLSELTPSHRQGWALGWIGGLEDLGLVVGGAMMGFLLTYAGRQPACATLMLVLAAGGLFCWLTIREQEWQRPRASA